MNQDERKTAARRMMLLIAVAGVIIGLYGFRLIFLQLVNGDSFKAQATNTTDYKFTVTAARGNIVDSKGERIASSVTGYNVVLNKLLMATKIWTPCSRSWSACWARTARAGTTACSSGRQMPPGTMRTRRRATTPPSSAPLPP